ncbi:hypothetical protein BpHYR1_045376 [Brachionus plicatilis]|uniref:Uncharacterized protein n=1 Tax=Brachionus plicatilis TaxID=10195 RepID=A0A3M7QWZ1_BRAPC|nr:hypothetical protein BpHYR1_045376 [Brachionus plicatilis]
MFFKIYWTSHNKILNKKLKILSNNNKIIIIIIIIATLMREDWINQTISTSLGLEEIQKYRGNDIKMNEFDSAEYFSLKEIEPKF